MGPRPCRIAALALVLAVSASLRAGQDETDAFINAEMARQRIPGLSLAIIKDGRIVKSQGYGLADRDRRIAAMPATVYKIASVSKQFIATGIVLLAQQGQLGLDDSIGTYLEGAPAAWKPITIRHLLTHTSGLIREGPAFNPSKVQSDAEVVRSAYARPLEFPPGRKWLYSNTGYFALAEIIRNVSGQPWTDYLADNVFTPSGMTHTFPTNSRAAVSNRAVGYVDNDRLLVAPEWPALRPSGAFISTVLDLAKWDAMLDADKILSADSRTQMWTPVVLSDGTTHPYGFGWQLAPSNGQPRVYHTGGMPGARAAFVKFPKQRLTIIALMNLDDVDIESIIGGLAALHLPPR